MTVQYVDEEKLEYRTQFKQSVHTQFYNAVQFSVSHVETIAYDGWIYSVLIERCVFQRAAKYFARSVRSL